MFAALVLSSTALIAALAFTSWRIFVLTKASDNLTAALTRANDTSSRLIAVTQALTAQLASSDGETAMQSAADALNADADNMEAVITAATPPPAPPAS